MSAALCALRAAVPHGVLLGRRGAVCGHRWPTPVAHVESCSGVTAAFRRHRGDYAPETELTIDEITNIIQRNEFALDFTDGPIKTYESNQLASNQPCEDVRSEATCLHTGGHLLGVFDGHAGGACAQIIAKRLLRYVGSGLVPAAQLRQLLADGARSDSFLQCHNDQVDFVSEIRDVYERSFARYASELHTNPAHADKAHVAHVMEHAAQWLDDDLSAEALRDGLADDARTMSVAMSGAVACTVHVAGNELHVSSTGDCGAVLGSLGGDADGQWVARKLSATHSAENAVEVRRVLEEHPAGERHTVIRAERLLGQLAPLRAFGDFRYKWPRDVLEDLVEPQWGRCVAPGYLTPPYLTARPEVTKHVLTPRDRFLVLATDGLWDMISPVQAVQLVGEHMSGKTFLKPLRLPRKNMSMGEISTMLAARKVGLSIKPLDANVASHLIRNALGGTEYGIEHTKISHLLTLPGEIVRMFRDDITVTVVYFDPDYIRSVSASESSSSTAATRNTA